MRKLFLLVAALVLGLSATAMAQTTAPEMEITDIEASRYAEGGQTTMVVEFRNLPAAPDPTLLQVTVDGQPVSNLEVAPLGESSVPVGVVLVIDTSGSMEGAPMQAAKDAAKSFIAQKRPEDSIAIVSFADTAVVQTGFTTNANDLNARIDGLVAAGETAFNDGVILGVSLFDNPSTDTLIPNMIVMSDGEDTASTATAEEALAAVSGSDVRTFGVALESPDFNPDAVAAVAAAGGGLFLSTPDPAALSGLYTQIAREISNTLITRFTSPVTTSRRSRIRRHLRRVDLFSDIRGLGLCDYHDRGAHHGAIHSPAEHHHGRGLATAPFQLAGPDRRGGPGAHSLPVPGHPFRKR